MDRAGSESRSGRPSRRTPTICASPTRIGERGRRAAFEACRCWPSTLDEFEERVGEVYAARTNADLRPVFGGLPSHADASPAQPRRDARETVRPLVLLALLVWAAFAFGAWVLIGLWFIVPRLLWGGGRHHRSHRAHHDRKRDQELTRV